MGNYEIVDQLFGSLKNRGAFFVDKFSTTVEKITNTVKKVFNKFSTIC